MRFSWSARIAALCMIASLGPSALCFAAGETKPQTAVSPEELSKFVGWFDFFQKRSAKKYAVTGPNPVDESAYVRIGDIDQWVTIRGQDRNNPVLLILHGGPGDVTSPWGYVYFHDWEKYFTVVQWDQRGAGKTLEKSGESIASTMSIDRMMQDGLEVSAYLRQHLSQDRIVLVGHSWGSLLGMPSSEPARFRAPPRRRTPSPTDSHCGGLTRPRMQKRWRI
jgi:alpha/beta hydrolase fold